MCVLGGGGGGGGRNRKQYDSTCLLKFRSSLRGEQQKYSTYSPKFYSGNCGENTIKHTSNMVRLICLKFHQLGGWGEGWWGGGGVISNRFDLFTKVLSVQRAGCGGWWGGGWQAIT